MALAAGSVTLPNIRIPMVFNFIADDTTEKIKRAIHKAIIIGIRKCINEAIDLAEEIVPESIYGDYPKSYVSEDLMGSFIDFMKGEANRLFTGKRTLQPEYHIKQRWAASYAEYVNEMVGVNWSKPGSHGRFIEEIDTFLRQNLCRYIDKQLNKVDPTLTLMYQVV
jgi:hypothetical protein